MRVFGKYEALEELQSGSASSIYRGYDSVLKREVVIKTFSSKDMTPTAKKRFCREMESTTTLVHPSIVASYDCGEEGETLYVAMESLDGEDVRSFVDRKATLPADVQIQFLIDVCDGLAFAHENGFLHRDINPSTIFVLRSHKPKILGFSIDRSFLSKSAAATAPEEDSLYFAPEQLKGMRGDARSDIFSATMVFFELLTHRHPFQGSDVPHQILNSAPLPITKVNPALPKRLAAVIAKGLSKDPANRFQTFGEYGTLLRRLVSEEPGLPVRSVSEAPVPAAVPLDRRDSVGRRYPSRPPEEVSEKPRIAEDRKPQLGSRRNRSRSGLQEAPKAVLPRKAPDTGHELASRINAQIGEAARKSSEESTELPVPAPLAAAQPGAEVRPCPLCGKAKGTDALLCESCSDRIEAAEAAHRSARAPQKTVKAASTAVPQALPPQTPAAPTIPAPLPAAIPLEIPPRTTPAALGRELSVEPDLPEYVYGDPHPPSRSARIAVVIAVLLAIASGATYVAFQNGVIRFPAEVKNPADERSRAPETADAAGGDASQLPENVPAGSDLHQELQERQAILSEYEFLLMKARSNLENASTGMNYAAVIADTDTILAEHFDADQGRQLQEQAQQVRELAMQGVEAILDRTNRLFDNAMNETDLQQVIARCDEISRTKLDFRRLQERTRALRAKASRECRLIAPDNAACG